MDKYIGRLLDNRYEILDVIGTGGMAVVYRARCHRLNRLVAIKILKEEYSQDEEFRRRFHAESQAVAMLNHPNIVSVYDVSTNGDADYIVMELVDGITLKQYIERRGGYLNWKESLHFAMQIAKALEHAHNQGIVHRDIKPHNVMILKNGSAKVTDFGIARIMSSQSTLTKEALGSVHYISPEQAKGGRVDNRSDLYSLGVVMYEMLTGRPPYDGESPVAVALKHINGGAPMPSTINPNIPGGLEQIIMHAMEVDPARRYSSATEMLYDMEEFRKNPNTLFYFDEPVQARAAAPVGAGASAPQQPRRPAPRSTAERVAGPRQEQPRAREPERPRYQEPERPRYQEPERSRRYSEEAEEEQPRRNKGLFIAIGIGAVAVVIALVVLVVLVTKGSGTTMLEVPNFVGEVFKEIDPEKYPNLRLVDSDYTYSNEYEAGKVISQDPVARTQVAEGSTVKLVISNGPQTGQMGDLVNRTEEKAREYLDGLKDLHLSVTLEEEFSSDIAAGRVTRTDPEADEILTVGQTVTLWISKGPQTATLDDLAGQPQTNAEAYLRNLPGMNLEIRVEKEASEDVEEGKIIRTEPGKGATLTAGQTVTLYVSTGSDVVMTTVPEVLGMDIRTAASMLTGKNLKYDYDLVESDKPKDEVIEQDQAKGTEVPEGTVVKLKVSKGPAETTAPPTTPPTTEPEPQVVSKTVTLALPSDITVEYQLQIYKGNSPCTEALIVEPGTSEVPVSLEGKGTEYFDVYVNGKLASSFKVDFSAATGERITLRFTVDG